VREVSWIRWRLAPTWWRLRGKAVCAEFLSPVELARVFDAVRADEELRRPFAYLVWKLSRELRGVLLVGFEAKLRSGRAPALAAAGALSGICRELRSREARVCESLLRAESEGRS
jgi:hypothetical protein